MAQDPNGSNSEAQVDLGTSGIVAANRSESEFVNCNVEFGRYNPFGTSEVFNVPYKNKSNAHFFTRANIAIEKTNFSGILPEKGPYVAIVLRVESNQIDKQKGDKNWIERGEPERSTMDPSFSIRARIPELHAHLPIPKRFESAHSSEDITSFEQLERAAQDDTDILIINLYPVFACKPGANTQIPQVGSLVLVDFNDRFRSNGYYIESLSSTSAAKTKKVYGQSSKPFSSGSKVGDQSLGSKNAKGQTNSPEPSSDTQVVK
jgi:hypothetical protein